MISAEIPDPEVDPELHDSVTHDVMHGPCGAANPFCPCMVDGVCSRDYPMQYRSESVVSNGYIEYKRRSPQDGGRTATVRKWVAGKEVDVTFTNADVVPCSPYLIKRYGCHINVELSQNPGNIRCLYVRRHASSLMPPYVPSGCAVTKLL